MRIMLTILLAAVSIGAKSYKSSEVLVQIFELFPGTGNNGTNFTVTG